MEDVFTQLAKDASGSRYKNLREACTRACDTLDGQSLAKTSPVFQLREICLEPLRLAFEAKNNKLATFALGGLQKLIVDKRFKSNSNEEKEENQMLMQVLKTLTITPSLPDDQQVEIMKFLLTLTCSENYVINASAALRVSEFCVEVFSNSKVHVKNKVKTTLIGALSTFCKKHTSDLTKHISNHASVESSKICIATFKASHQVSTHTAVKATITQMLSSISLHLRDRQKSRNEAADDIVAEFSSQGQSSGPTEALCDDVVKVLEHFCKKLENSHSDIDKFEEIFCRLPSDSLIRTVSERWTGPQSQQLMVLYLECVLSILNSSSTDLRTNDKFIQLIWQQLCPTLISILGNPKNEKSITSSHNMGGIDNDAFRSVSDHGRGSGCSATAPTVVHSAAKSIYAIGVELLRLVGSVGSLRPVLASLFHRFLLYPPPQHRYEALKAIKEVLCNPQRVLDMAGPPLYDTKSLKSSETNRSSHLDLLKLLLDGIVESSHSNESTVCHTSVTCIAALLDSLEAISEGKALTDLHIMEINKHLESLDLQETRPVQGWNQPDNAEKPEDPTPVLNNGIDTEAAANEDENDEKTTASDDVTKNVVSHDDVINGDPEISVSVEDVEGPGVNGDGNAESVERSDNVMTTQTDVTGKELCDIKPLEDEAIETLAEPCVVESCTTKVGATKEMHRSEKQATETQQITQQETSSGGKQENDKTVLEQQKRMDEEIRRKQISAEAEMEKQRQKRREELEKIAMMNAEAEKEGARDFLAQLINLLPSLISLADANEVDEAILKFAARFCSAVEAKRRKAAIDGGNESNSGSPVKQATMPILNADGIYVATYSALLLSLKLAKLGHYQQATTVPVSENEFINRIHDGVFLVYLSSTWLTELYNQVVVRDLLGEAGCCHKSLDCNNALITLLTDIDGLGNRNIGGQMLHNATSHTSLAPSRNGEEQEDSVEAGIKFAKVTLVTIWEQVLEVLSVPLATKNITVVGSIAFLLGTEGSKEQNSRDRDAIMMSLDGLRKAARLSCTLGVQDRCATVLTQLANASCVYADPTVQHTDPKKQSLRSRIATANRTGVRLHTSHILSMDALLNMGLEIGSHSPESWTHVFRCCAYVSQLEHSHFSSGNTQHSVSITRVQEQQADSQPMYDNNDLDMMSAYTQPVSTPIQQAINIHEIIKQNSEEMGFDVTMTRGGVLSVANAAKAVYGLSSDVDRLFEEAASNLNLQALVSFLRHLCRASQTQLFENSPCSPDITMTNPTMPSKSISTAGKLSNVTSLHLYRVADVMLKCVRDDSRPLLHIMQVWGVVAPHLVEAACHKERQVSKKAVTAIHDVLTELLSRKTELPHFNFHESLFKPFESMLCLELCDDDVQDQVVSSICELVEASASNIKSGWRPLFGALRAVKVHKQRIADDDRIQHHTAPVFDVFEAFLNTDNVFVFANAAVDCILCLLKFVRGPGECELITEDDEDGRSDSSSTAASERSLPLQALDLCLPALDYLHRCHKILASIYTMPACPMFHGSQSIQLNTAMLSADLDSPIREFSSSVTSTVHGLKLKAQDSTELMAPVSIEDMDDETGIIKVWFLLLEGLTGAVSMCPRNYQPQTLELLFDLLRYIASIPGPQFAVFAVTNLLLPMLVSWVHRSTRTSYWDTSLANFKHACGLSAELVVDHLIYFVTSDITITGVHRMIKQLFDLLIECIGQPMESISRLGCSCIRHVLLRAGPIFTDDMWTIACKSMQQAVSVSLYSVQLLMTSFHPGSDDFTGDVGQVKVAARRDCSEMESERLRQIAQQVFLLDSQFTSVEPDDSDDNRSFIFIVYPPDADTTVNIDLIKTRIPFRSVVVGLMANQILMQTLGTVLLYGAEHKMTSEKDIISNTAVQSNLQRQESVSSIDGTQTLLPGLLSYLSSRNLSLLLDCFIESYKTACDFDTRPGLKFLLQKVARLDVAVNLYRQTALSFTFYLHTLLEICHHAKEDSLVLDRVKESLMSVMKAEQSQDAVIQKEFNEKGDSQVEEESDEVVGKEESENAEGEKLRSVSVSSAVSTDSRGKRVGADHLGSLSVQLTELSFHPDENGDQLMWVVKRLLGVCCDVCVNYVQLHLDQSEDVIDTERIAEQPLFLLVAPMSPDESVHKGKRLFSFPPLDKQPSHDLEDSTDAKSKNAVQWSPKIKMEDTSRLEAAFNIKKAERKLEKKNSREEGKLYSVATNKTIKSLMQEYKKRKVHHSRSTFVKKPTFKEQKVALQQMKKQKSSTPEDQKRQQEIHKQQQSATMRDCEAHMKAWTDMILSMLELFQLLPDHQFRCLLPATFPAVNQLVCHVQDDMVRQSIMEYMDRVARIHGILC